MTTASRIRPATRGLGNAVRCWQCRFASSKAEQAEARAAFAAKVTESLRGDEHGDTLTLKPEVKRIQTAAGDLPISPLMDPEWMEATSRHKTPKPKAKSALQKNGRFRKKLLMNPYGQSLASYAPCAELISYSSSPCDALAQVRRLRQGHAPTIAPEIRRRREPS